MTIEGSSRSIPATDEQGILNPTPDLLRLRDQIDEVDRQLLPLIGRRLQLVTQVGEIKKSVNLPIRDRIREGQKLDALARQGEELGIEDQAIRQVWSVFFEIAYRLEE